MSRGDLVLLALWCLMIFVGYRFFEIGSPTTAVFAVLIGGAAFALRLYLARRTFRR